MGKGRQEKESPVHQSLPFDNHEIYICDRLVKTMYQVPDNFSCESTAVGARPAPYWSTLICMSTLLLANNLVFSGAPYKISNHEWDIANSM